MPVVLSDDLVWAFSTDTGGFLDPRSYSIQLPQKVHLISSYSVRIFHVAHYPFILIYFPLTTFLSIISLIQYSSSPIFNFSCFPILLFCYFFLRFSIDCRLYPALPYPILPCPALPYPALSYPTLPCPALSYLPF